MKERRRETIERLKEAMAEMETEDGLVSFVEGHGVQSRFFAFSWRSDDLEIDFRLPFARALSDEEEQQLDTARVGAAIKLAILMLSSSDAGTLLHEGEKSISVFADQSGPGYSVTGENGEEIDSGDSFEPLVARMDAAFGGEKEQLVVIWP